MNNRVVVIIPYNLDKYSLQSNGVGTSGLWYIVLPYPSCTKMIWNGQPHNTGVHIPVLNCT